MEFPAESPFAKGNDRAGRVEEAVAAAEAKPDEKVTEEAAKAPAETAPDEADQLFADAPAAEADAEEADEEEVPDLFDEPAADGKPKAKTVPLTRLNKVIAQREELRQAVPKLEGALAEARALNAAVAESYADFDDPATQIAWDAKFASVAEELQKTDPGVARAWQAVVAQMEGKRPNVSEEKQTTPEIKGDPRVDKMLAATARDRIDTVLAGAKVKPSFRKLIAAAITTTEGVDLADLSKAEIVSHASEWIKTGGFGRDEIIEGGAPPAKEGAKPATTGGGKPGTPRAKTKAEAEEKPPEPKSREEWEQNRESRFARAFESAMGE